MPVGSVSFLRAGHFAPSSRSSRGRPSEFRSEIVLNPSLHTKAKGFRQRVAFHVKEIYGDEDADEITDELMEAANIS